MEWCASCAHARRCYLWAYFKRRVMSVRLGLGSGARPMRGRLNTPPVAFTALTGNGAAVTVVAVSPEMGEALDQSGLLGCAASALKLGPLVVAGLAVPKPPKPLNRPPLFCKQPLRILSSTDDNWNTFVSGTARQSCTYVLSRQSAGHRSGYSWPML